MKSFFSTFAFLASASTVLGHATFQQLWIDGVDQAENCTRVPPSNSPVTDVTSTDLRCNVGGATGISGLCSVPAGANVTVEMHQQPNDRSCANEAIGGAHYGPIIIYLSKVADATTNQGDGEWFKVDEEGYNVTTKWWGTQTLNANCGHRSFTLPSDLAPGNYLIRAEVIALHAAGSTGGAQFYMSCYQINVSGSGTATPAGVLFPGAYSATDPGILIDIYSTINNYTIPGPADVFTG
ncbi:hypothetical protein BP5796_08495 [Coleophoma crateriformis]|uniref:AA9 family lytic polysaccharide monooxygenase n=2 Tax=Coleophoma TaxID=453209 RepID=A0A3D8STC1_9HELO|nr:hypothetical protein BP5796_08495 [Coleophoma crateriformis]RDW89542.1 hypothetical protein BP6252_01574 [Coleophoma cylindrospora]